MSFRRSVQAKCNQAKRSGENVFQVKRPVKTKVNKTKKTKRKQKKINKKR